MPPPRLPRPPSVPPPRLISEVVHTNHADVPEWELCPKVLQLPDRSDAMKTVLSLALILALVPLAAARPR